MNKVRLIVVTLLAATFATPGIAQNIFESKLQARQVVGGSDAPFSGMGMLTLNPAQDALTYSISLNGLDLDGQQTPADSADDVTSIHFHNAPAGSNGGIVFGLIGPNNDADDLVIDPVAGTLNGSWEATDENPLTAEDIAILRTAGIYLNIHTNSHPGGAIRGQVRNPPFIRKTFLSSDPEGVHGFANQSNTNPDIPHILDLDCSSGDPLVLGEPIIADGGTLTILGVPGTLDCVVDSSQIGTQPLVGAMNSGNLEVEIVDLPLHSVAPISLSTGGNVTIRGGSMVSNGNAPAVVADGGSFRADMGVFRTSCESGNSWTVDATNSVIDLNGVSFVLGSPCINAALDCPTCDANVWNSYLGAPVNDTDRWTGRGVVHEQNNYWNTGESWDLPSLEESNFFQREPDDGKVKALCNDFGTGAFTSLGFNIDTDGSCALDQPTDLPNTDPMISIDENGIPQPMAGSPVIESGPVDFVNNELPCLYKDLNGLGRPQDFDLDGIFTCDRGPVEVQGGPDIGAPQSAAFYDTGRDGEGVFVELLENGTAIISFYTYSPDGNNMVWFVGIGRVVGNSVVVDEMQHVTGGVFGAGFDPAHIVRTPVGGMSLIFPDCEAIDSPGMLNFTAKRDSGFENLLHKAFRLTSIFDCDGSAPTANANRSGAFFAPNRSGEGIFVEWLSDGRVVIVFYTFDPEGNPFWVTSVVDDTSINGNTVVANMLYAEGKTKFGANFNPDEVNLSSWGTITLTYSDDNNLTFAYDSSVLGFGAGNHAYTRLTKLLGTN